MKTYVRYSMAVLVGGLLLGLIGCGSSNNSCPSGQTMTTNGCGTGSCNVPGTNQVGAMVGASCYALSGTASTAYTCMQGLTLQTLPAPYSSYPQYAQSGGQACCPQGINLSMYNPMQVCQPAMNGSNPYGYNNGYNNGYGNGINYGNSCPPGFIPNGMGGCVI